MEMKQIRSLSTSFEDFSMANGLNHLPFVSVDYIFSQTNLCCCKSDGFNDGVKLAVHNWRDETSQDENICWSQLAPKYEKLTLIGLLHYYHSITNQASIFSTNFQKVHEEKTKKCLLFSVPCGQEAGYYES